MRVDEREAVIRAQIVRDELLQERTFAGAGFPENMRVEPPILVQDAEDPMVVPEIDACKK
jgi:hypothetical protein